MGTYVAGALALLGIAAVNLWKLWRSGSYPAPSPFPNYDYRYLQRKYGAAYPDGRRKRGATAGSRKALEQPGLWAADTLESIDELGSLELMSRELGLAPYGPLKKSVSADSLSSVSSIGNSFGQDFTVGQLEVNLEYAGRSQALHVALLQGKDLLEKDEGRLERCFVRVSLLPAERVVGISRVSRRLRGRGAGAGRRRRGGVQPPNRSSPSRSPAPGPARAALQRLALPAGCEQDSGLGGRDPALPELPAHGRAPDGGGGEGQKPRVDQRQRDCRSLRQGVPAAGREEDQQEEDSGQEGRPQPRVQRGHDFLGAGHRAPGQP
uniref:Synaptotagmin 12 n=1 Tax=Apteryx owenii TaxID=8824 RepID=A0A8B9PM22_APTOW